MTHTTVPQSLPDPRWLDSISLQELESLIKEYLRGCNTVECSAKRNPEQETEELRKLSGVYNIKAAKVMTMRHVSFLPAKGSSRIIKGSLEKIKDLIYHLQSVSGEIDWKYTSVRHTHILNFKKHVDMVTEVLQAAVRIDGATSELMKSDGVIFS